MNRKIHIKISDKNWILEKCAAAIADRNPNVTYGTRENCNADIQYYITYSAWQKRISPIEVAFFTHIENDINAEINFFRVAREVDHCITMADRYKNIIEGFREGSVTQILPGVDKDIFKPIIKVGIIGRTYHTGRKGEEILSKIGNIPGIELICTGEGWPIKHEYVPPEKLPAFYNDLDYVLVPSLIEGGPMSVIEAIACGKDVISSDVGWVPNYPHIPFENGSVDSLRLVLGKIVAEKKLKQRSIDNQTWDKWADDHMVLFENLLKNRYSCGRNAGAIPRPTIALITHGSELGNLGGPTVRVPETAKFLQSKGVNAIHLNSNGNIINPEIVHVFNVWETNNCMEIINSAKKKKKHVVLSPIFLNLKNHHIFSKNIPYIFETNNAKARTKKLREIDLFLKQEKNLPLREIYPGYHEQVRSCINSSDSIILLSDYERDCLKYIGCDLNNSFLVRNSVSPNRFTDAKNSLFKDKFQLEKYILCVGRIEPRKNQLMLASAARELNRHVVFIGHPASQSYYKLVREIAGEYGVFINRLDPESEMLTSAFNDADLFCLPSWAEGAPLAALEADKFGLPLVLSNASGEAEYFGDNAYYVAPSDYKALCDILSAQNNSKSIRSRINPKANEPVARYKFSDYISNTLAVYNKTLNDKIIDGQFIKDISSKELTANNVSIIFDVTDYIYANGKQAGIPRVIYETFKILVENENIPIIYVAWKLDGREFYQLPKEIIFAGSALTYLEQTNSEELRINNIEDISNPVFLCLAGAWATHTNYCLAVLNIKRMLRLPIVLMAHDLVRLKYAYLYPSEAVNKFRNNSNILFPLVDRFLVYSATTGRDLIAHLNQNNFISPDIKNVFLGESHILRGLGSSADEIIKSELIGREFVVYVSSFDKRKNHKFILDVWRKLKSTSPNNTPILVLIGRQMWSDDQALREIRDDKSLLSFVKHFPDISDATLEWVYNNCLFTVFPSVYEGWGLPVSESLAFGKMCFTTNGSSTAEIAPNLVELLSPYDISEWVRALMIYLENRELLAQRESMISKLYKPKQWVDAVNSIIDQLDHITRQPISTKIVMLNSAFEITTSTVSIDKPIITFFNDDWTPIETSGIWMLKRETELDFEVVSPNRDTVSIYLEVASLDTQLFHVVHNENIVYTGQSSRSKSKHFFDISIQNSCNFINHQVNLSLVVSALKCPMDFGSSSDNRKLGLRLSSIGVFSSIDLAIQSTTYPHKVSASSDFGPITTIVDDDPAIGYSELDKADAHARLRANRITLFNSILNRYSRYEFSPNDRQQLLSHYLVSKDYNLLVREINKLNGLKNH